MIKYLFLILIFCSIQYSYSQNNSLIIAKVDSIVNIQSKEIHDIMESLSEHRMKESFFRDELNAQTVIFSVIVTIVVFFDGFLLPKLWEKKEQDKFKQNKIELEAIKNEIEKGKDELKMVALEGKLNFQTLVFIESVNSENKIIPFVNSLICLADTIELKKLKKEEIKDSDINTYIIECHSFLTDIEIGTASLERRIDDINQKLDNIVTNLKLEDSLSELKRIKKEINRIYYTKPKPPRVAANFEEKS